jgi:transcriptional regulator GlxA family with amidase domain
MAEHAGTLLTPSDAAAEVGISLRSLQAGFRRLRNETPGAFLRRVRLQNAYDELRRSNGEVSVTDVALRCGFAHLGRFSSSYQAAFGELPSDTLRRARLSNQRRGR